jgi:lipid-binding SYLF domain-containing protein
MTSFRVFPVAGLLLLAVAAAPLWAGERELKTVTAATEVVHQFCAIPLHGIPPHLLHEASGVAILPNVLKAGLLVDGRFGRGVALVRQPDGTWSNPAFITLHGLGLGGQAGVESTDLVLVFKTRHSLDRVLLGKRKVTLGGDVSVAAGPVGRDAEVATDARLKAEVLSYSRSRGLFVGVSLEGATLRVDREANEAFYGFPGGPPATAVTHPGVEAVQGLRTEMFQVSTPPPPPVPVVPPTTPIAPPPTPAIVAPPPPPAPVPVQPWQR